MEFGIQNSANWSYPFLSEDPKRLNLWWPRVMNVFGNTKGRANDIYVRLGLKRRTNSDVRDAFLKDIKVLCDRHELEIPVYDESLQPV